MGEAARKWEAAAARKPWSVQRVGDTVSARFVGHLDSYEGRASAEAFVRAIGSDRVDVRFDIREMKGYESAARKVWTHSLRPVASQMRGIEIRGGSALVKMGGSVIGAVLGVPVHFT